MDWKHLGSCFRMKEEGSEMVESVFPAKAGIQFRAALGRTADAPFAFILDTRYTL